LDFPKYVSEGKDESGVSDILLLVLTGLAIAILVIVLLALGLNNMAINKKLYDEEAKGAVEEEGQVRSLLESGGNQKLAALKAAREGKATISLPSAVPMAASLPAPAELAGEPMTAQPMEAVPSGWVAAPMSGPGPE